MDIALIKKIHFVGIGGIGISAIARMMKSQGKRVTGNDLGDFPINRALEKIGIPISIGKTLEQIPKDAELIVYSVAWNDMASELLEAIRNLKIPMLSYPEMLKVISEKMVTIAVSGTHGKTTTTAMIAKIMREGGFDPTVIVGSLLKPGDFGLEAVGSRTLQGTNFVAGKSVYFLVEADEYRRAFLNLSPQILVITNVDLDHLDYYKNMEDIQSAFTLLASKIPADGALICDLKNPNIIPILKIAKCKIIDYSEISLGVNLAVPGKHNIANAKAAFAVGQFLGINDIEIQKALSQFNGTWRRFEYLGATGNGALVYDDYAHNPQKIRGALDGAREKFRDKKIIAVFQPHLYSRTKLLIDEFAQSFNDADSVVVAPIYGAREAFDSTIDSSMLVSEIKKHHIDALHLEDFKKISDHISKTANNGDVIVCLGAGDISNFCEELITGQH